MIFRPLGANRKYPFIPTVTGEIESHTNALRALSESVLIHERRTKDIDNSFVRVHELVDMGLITIKDGQFNVIDIDITDISGIDIDPGEADTGDVIVWNGATQAWEIGDHGDIGGLGDDDHPQYTAWAQDESITGQWQWSDQLWGPNGSAGSPSFSFTTDDDTGMYRVGANQLGFSTGSTLRVTIDGAVSVTSTLPFYAPNGSNSIPAYTFSGDPDTGMYHVGTNNVGLATGGALHWDMTTARTLQDVYGVIRNYQGLLVENPDYLNAGIELTTITGTSPLTNGIGNQLAFWEVGVGGSFTDRSYGFRIRHTGEIDAEGNLDFYRHTDNVSGILFMRFTRESSQIQIVGGGAAGTPTLTFINDLNCGFYSRVNDELNFSTNATERLAITNGGILPTVPIRAAFGSDTSPSYAFNNDENTGMYRVAADSLGFATNGVLRLTIANALITSTLPIQLTTLDLGSTTDTTLSRASAGVLAVEGHNVPTVDQAQSISAIYSFTVAPRFGATLSPSQIVANVDNYAPTGIGDASHLRLNSDASREITGITTGTTGRWLIITNVGSFNLVFRNQNLSSTDVNRFLFDDGASMTLEAAQTRHFWYDATTQRWRCLLAGSGGGGGIVDSVVEGEAIDVDSTDTANPIVSLDIPSLSADATPDPANDYVVTYDDSGSAHKKVLLQDLPTSSTASGMIVRYDVYTADDTWNKPDGFTFGIAIGIGQGGGGASGRLGVAGGGRVGGGGGGGGGRAVVNFTDADVGATAAINVNGGGNGGAARTTTAQDGANGVAGESTTFGSLLTAGGGGGGTGGAAAGNSAAGTGGSGNAGAGSTGGTGYATAATTPSAIAGGSTGAGGGCGGAGVTSGNTDGAGGAGAASLGAAGGIAPAGSPPGGDGGAGGSVGGTYNTGGGGGGSGNGSDVSTTLGGDGGVGGQWGGGGGGGAGSTLLTTVGESGAGGNGGQGVLVVLSWCNVGADNGLIDSIVAGTGINVDISDPINPIVSVGFVDSEELRFGTGGDDLAIYHDGTNNYIDSNTGALFLRGNPGSSHLEIETSASGFVMLSGTGPSYRTNETDAASDEKVWAMGGDAGGVFTIRTRTDALGAGNSAISITRTGTTVSVVRLLGETRIDACNNNSVVFSTTYTPTLTNVANFGTLTAQACQYMRVGNAVTVSGTFTVDPTTAATLSRFRCSLPVASAFTNARECAGVAVDDATSGAGTMEGWRIFADATNDEAEFRNEACSGAASRLLTFTFTYRII